MTGDPKAIAAASTAAAAITIIAIAVVWNDSLAGTAADRAPVVSASTPPSVLARFPRKPVEQAPPVGESMVGDGTWVIGREIKPGRYRTAGGRSCVWARLQARPEAAWATVTSPPRSGPQAVVLGDKDVAFASRGCAQWVMVR